MPIPKITLYGYFSCFDTHLLAASLMKNKYKYSARSIDDPGVRAEMLLLCRRYDVCEADILLPVVIGRNFG